MANYSEQFVLLGIGLFTLAFRTSVRIRAVRFSDLMADDYLMVFAGVLYLTETYLAYIVGARYHGLANSGMTDAQRAALDIHSEEYGWRVNGSKTQVAGWSIYSLLLWTIKAAMCTYYLRLSEGLLAFRRRIYVGFAMILATWPVVVLSILLGCHPLHKNWQINPNPGRACQPALSYTNVLVTLVLNIITDMYLLAIPMPLFWTVRTETWRKIGLVALFSGGIFVTVAGLLRCVLILGDTANGASQGSQWAVRETFVAIMTSNLPVVFPVFRNWLKPLLGSIIASYSKNTRPSRLEPGTVRLDDRSVKSGEGSGRDPYAIDDLDNDSEERIMSVFDGSNSKQIRKVTEITVSG